MLNLSSRKYKMAVAGCALAVGAAIAVPLTASAAEPPAAPQAFVNTSDLTAHARDAATEITATLPAGTNYCQGPFVYAGKFTAEQVLTGPPLPTAIWPTTTEGQLFGTAEVVAYLGDFATDAQVSPATYSPTLGAGETTAMMACSFLDLETGTPGPMNLYLRDIVDGDGVGGDNGETENPFGSLDIFGSLGQIFSGLGALTPK